MSRYFVNDPPVPIYEFEPGSVLASDGTPAVPNVIWIKPRMSVETKGRVTSELVTLGSDHRSVEFRAGANEMALLMHNIVRWEGPDLSGAPCTPEYIRTMDSSEPHIARVLEAIAERNAPKASPNPKSPAVPGSKANGSDGGRLVDAIARRERSGILTSP